MRRTTPWRQIGKPKPDKVNREGFPSFSRTPEEDLVNVLMTGTTASHFYASGVQMAEEMAQVLRDFKDVEFQTRATIYARQNGYTRELPVASLVSISSKDVRLFRAAWSRVCLNPKDWQKFIDIARSGVFRDGLGRALKEAIISAIESMPVFHAMKYPKAVRDMIRVARPRESVNPAVIRYIMEGKHEGEQLEALHRLKSSEDPREIARIIREARLPYEVVTGAVRKMSPEVWGALFNVAPYFNLIRNLNNFGRNGVFENDDNVEKAVQRITNREAIRNSRLFPFRFFIAHEMLESFTGVDRIRAALREALEASVENVPPLEGKVCIASDASGSMSSHLTGEYSVVECADVVGVFTGMLIKKCRKLPIVLPFSDDIRWDIIERVQQAETIMEVATCFDADGGTSLSAPVEYLMREREEVDYFIAFTDNEEWVGRSFLDAFLEYRRRVAPHCKAYLVTLVPYRDYPVPPQIPDVHFIFGWSDSVLKYITTDPEQQMKEIEAVQIS